MLPYLTSRRFVLIISFHLRQRDIGKCADHKGRTLETSFWTHRKTLMQEASVKITGKVSEMPTSNQSAIMWSNGKPCCVPKGQCPYQGLRVLRSIQSLQSRAITIMAVCFSREERAMQTAMLCYQGCEGYKTNTPPPPRTSQSHNFSFSCRTVQVTDTYMARVTLFLSYISFFCKLYFYTEKKVFFETFNGKPTRMPTTEGWSNFNILICIRNVTDLIFSRYTDYSDSFPICLPSDFRKIAKSDHELRDVFRPHGTTCLPLDGFSWNSIWVFFAYEGVSKILRTCAAICGSAKPR
jgi:hypothetical protein